jgi:excisionase family DNA binding protein
MKEAIPEKVLSFAAGVLAPFVGGITPDELGQLLAKRNDAAEPQSRGERLLTKAEAAKRLGVSWITIHRLAKSGKIRVVHPSSGTVRIRESDLERHMRRGVEPCAHLARVKGEKG